MTAPCCSGINGSHTLDCDLEVARRPQRLVCWCCGATFPVGWACLWSDHGSRCFACDDAHWRGLPCRAHVDQRLEDVRDAGENA
jgi:hypothetical protein